MTECPICGSWFDERAYQVIVWGVGSFDSVDCAEKAARRQARQSVSGEALVQEALESEPEH